MEHRWSDHLSSVQQRFHYIHIQAGFFDICLEVPARQGHRKIVLSLELTRDFPSVAPTLRCKYERHMFIDGSTFVIKPNVHPGLEFWKPGNDLGLILHEIHTKVFNVTPPIPMSPMWDSTYGSPLAVPLDKITDNAILNHIIDSSDLIAQASASSAAPSTQSRLGGVEELTLADFTALLTQKSLLELETIGKEPHAFLHECDRLSGLRKLEAGRSAQYEQIKQLEAETKAAQAALEEAENIIQVLAAHKSELDTTLASLHSQHQQLSGAFSKQAICDALLALAQREELHSEDLGTLFSKGTLDPATGKPALDLDSFLSNYMASRTLYRLRLDKRAVVLSTPTAAVAPAPSASSPPIWTNPHAHVHASSMSPPSPFSSNRPPM